MDHQVQSFEVHSLFQYLMSFKMTKRELQHMIYMKETETYLNIKGDNGGKKNKKEEEGSVGVNIHKICMRRNTK